MEIVGLALIVACVAALLFFFIGVVPGTDETATLAPLTLIVVLWGLHPGVILSWFMAAAVAMQISHCIPTAIAAIPGSTTAVPFVQHCGILKRLGLPHVAIRKMAAGSVLGCAVALPVTLVVARLLSPLGEIVKEWAPVIFTGGAILIAYFSPARWLSIFMILPFALLVHGLQSLATASTGHRLFISIFLGIAVGPIVADGISLLAKASAEPLIRGTKDPLMLGPDMGSKTRLFPNPLRILTRRQRSTICATSALAALTFTFSPIGLTILLGEALTARIKEIYEKSSSAVAIMNSIANATYIAETLIPLIAFGIPLSPTAFGPAAPLFHAPPRFTGLEGHINNLHTMLAFHEFGLFSLVGVVAGIAVAYPLTMRHAWAMCVWVLRNVSHEALLGTFAGLIVLLASYEAGLTGVAISLSIAVFGGMLKRFFGVHIGVQYMAFYASPWIAEKLLG